MNQEPIKPDTPQEPVTEPVANDKESASRNLGRDLLLVVIVWGVVVLIALPFFYLLRTKGPEMLDKLKQRDPQMDSVRAEALYARGKLRFAEGKFEEAGYYLQRAAKITPNMADIYFYLGQIHKSQNQWDEATALYEETLNKDSNHVQARLDLASLLASQGKNYLAVEILLTLEDLLPSNSPIRDQEGFYGQLIPLAQELYEENPENLQSALVLGRYAMRQDNLEEAEDLFRQVLDRYPDNEAALLGLVDVSEKRGDNMQAVERLADFLRKHPSYVPLYDRLWQLSQRADETAETLTSGLYTPLDWLRPMQSLRGPRRSGIQLIGFDLIPRSTLQLNLFDVVLFWQQEQGIVWETEREQPIYRLQENLFARQSRLYEVAEENLVPNPGFECGRPGANLPAEWPGEFYAELNPSQGWVQVIEEDLPSQKINRYIRLDCSRMDNVKHVGIYSRQFDIRPGQDYLLGFRFRNRGGSPVTNVRFQKSTKREFKVLRPSVEARSSDWEIFYYFFKSPEDMDICNLVLANNSQTGTVDFDDVFLIPLKGLD